MEPIVAAGALSGESRPRPYNGAMATDATKAPDRPLWDGLIVGASLATLADARGYGEIGDGALGWVDGRICFVGPRDALPGVPAMLAREVIEADGWITPGLGDCHTHLVFAGDRGRAL